MDKDIRLSVPGLFAGTIAFMIIMGFMPGIAPPIVSGDDRKRSDVCAGSQVRAYGREAVMYSIGDIVAVDRK